MLWTNVSGSQQDNTLSVEACACYGHTWGIRKQENQELKVGLAPAWKSISTKQNNQTNNNESKAETVSYIYIHTTESPPTSKKNTMILFADEQMRLTSAYEVKEARLKKENITLSLTRGFE